MNARTKIALAVMGLVVSSVSGGCARPASTPALLPTVTIAATATTAYTPQPSPTPAPTETPAHTSTPQPTSTLIPSPTLLPETPAGIEVGSAIRLNPGTKLYFIDDPSKQAGYVGPRGSSVMVMEVRKDGYVRVRNQISGSEHLVLMSAIPVSGGKTPIAAGTPKPTTPLPQATPSVGGGSTQVPMPQPSSTPKPQPVEDVLTTGVETISGTHAAFVGEQAAGRPYLVGDPWGNPWGVFAYLCPHPDRTNYRLVTIASEVLDINTKAGVVVMKGVGENVVFGVNRWTRYVVYNRSDGSLQGIDHEATWGEGGDIRVGDCIQVVVDYQPACLETWPEDIPWPAYYDEAIKLWIGRKDNYAKGVVIHRQ